MPAGGGDLTFWTSYDTEADWDFLAVEARTAGGDDWTTLPDANNHTSQNTGQSGRLPAPSLTHCVQPACSRRPLRRPPAPP